MQSVIFYLEPWEFSPTVLLACTLPTIAYVRGLVLTRRAGEATGFWRPLAYFAGVGLIYIALQTYVDFLAQHMFWIHRLQQSILHHFAPFLVALAGPWDIMARGTPRGLRERVLRPFFQSWAVRSIYGFLQNPVVAPLLFVGLIYFWLTPAIHFTAMLDVYRYRAMNWGMVVDGMFFWWLMIGPRSAQGHASIGYLWRILILFFVMILQIPLGAYITFHGSILYNVYGICGRAWAINPMTDQQIGGLLTWIPPAMMGALSILVVIHRIMHEPDVRPVKEPAMVNAAGH
ncbi:MAG: cytochrome c oxidase assembly protein [Acidiferrobacterales bacterium]